MPMAGCMQSFGGCTGCLGLCTPDQHTAFIANFMLDVHNQKRDVRRHERPLSQLERTHRRKSVGTIRTCRR